MPPTPKDEPRRVEAFLAHFHARDGEFMSQLRARFAPIKGQAVAAERSFDEAQRFLLVPAELASASFNTRRTARISAALSSLADPKVRARFLAAVGEPAALAKEAKALGLQTGDLSWLVALTAGAAAIGVVAQAAKCGAECPYCHGLTCIFSGNCTLTAHGGKHKCNVNHQWA